MSWEFISNLLLASIRMATPLIFLSLAELYSQRAGLVHIGLEGLAAIGSLVGFMVSLITGSPMLGVLAGALVGILVNMVSARLHKTAAGPLFPPVFSGLAQPARGGQGFPFSSGPRRPA